MKKKSEKLQNIKKEMFSITKQELSALKGGKTQRLKNQDDADLDGGTLEEVVCTPDRC